MGRQVGSWEQSRAADGGHLGCKKGCFKNGDNTTHLSSPGDDPREQEKLKGDG